MAQLLLERRKRMTGSKKCFVGVKIGSRVVLFTNVMGAISVAKMGHR